MQERMKSAFARACCVYVRLKDGSRRTVETVKNEIEPRERDLCASSVRAFLCVGGCVLACRWVNCAAHGSPAVPH